MWIHSKEGNLVNLAQASSIIIKSHRTKDGLFELVVIFPGVASSSAGIPIADQHPICEGTRQEVTLAREKLAQRLEAGHIDGVSVAAE